jgi:hypothetical protein
VTTSAPIRNTDEYESRLLAYGVERGEEARAVRVGEKEVSEIAAIVARYEDLFTEPQLEALREAEEAETRPDARERLYRLRRSCESGVIVARLAAVQDALQNAELAARVEHRGESLPLRSATSKVATLSDYEEREELGGAAMAVSAGLNEQRLELMRAAEELRAKLSGEPDPIARAESEKQISLHQLVDVLAKASTRVSAA